METTANTYDDIITRSYEEYYQVILTYITYRITHRYEACLLYTSDAADE